MQGVGASEALAASEALHMLKSQPAPLLRTGDGRLLGAKRGRAADPFRVRQLGVDAKALTLRAGVMRQLFGDSAAPGMEERMVDLHVEVDGVHRGILFNCRVRWESGGCPTVHRPGSPGFLCKGGADTLWGLYHQGWRWVRDVPAAAAGTMTTKKHAIVVVVTKTPYDIGLRLPQRTQVADAEEDEEAEEEAEELDPLTDAVLAASDFILQLGPLVSLREDAVRRATEQLLARLGDASLKFQGMNAVDAWRIEQMRALCTGPLASQLVGMARRPQRIDAPRCVALLVAAAAVAGGLAC